MKYRFRRWRVILRRIVRRVVFSGSSANSIAWGVALGVFIGLTPTVGFQMIIAAFLATLFRVNRLAAIVPVWISNPFTLVPIYYLDFRVGATFLPVEGATRVREHFALLQERISGISITDLFATMSAALGEMGRLGFNILAPLFAGSIVVGALGAAAAYPLALWAVDLVRRRRRSYSIRRADRRIERLEREGVYLKTDTGTWKPVERRAPEQEEAEEAHEEGETRPKPLGPIVSAGGRRPSTRADDDSSSRSANGTRPGG